MSEDGMLSERDANLPKLAYCININPFQFVAFFLILVYVQIEAFHRMAGIWCVYGDR
jgi:hypothetical protein